MVDAFFHDVVGCGLARIENALRERFVGSGDFLAIGFDVGSVSSCVVVEQEAITIT